MKRITLFFRITTLLFVIAFVISCKKTENVNPGDNPGTPVNTYTPPAVTFSATVQGFVVDEAGNAVDGAEVKTGGKTAKTNVYGHFKIEAAPFTGDFCYIKAEKKGFFTGSTTIHGKAGSEYAAELVMVPQNNIVSFAATQGKTITLTGGAEVKLPANGFVTSTGKTYTGNVNAAVKHIDPAAKNFSSLIPGGDLRAFNANSQNVQLYSYGMLNVEMRDDAGNLLQLASGQKSTLTIPVPASMMSTAPATIPLWYFDEDKGVWIEEGKAALQGTNYVGTVSHFTPWNVDINFPPCIIKGKVVDNNGDPVELAKVNVSQFCVYTNADGTFQSFAAGNRTINVDVVDWETEQGIGVGQSVSTPASGQTINIGTITLPALTKVKIKAEVEDCNGNPLNGFAIIKKGNYTGRAFIRNSKFTCFLSPTGGEAEITMFSADASVYNTVKVTLPTSSSSTVIDLGTVKVCNNINTSYYIKFTYTLPGQAPVNVVKIATKTAEGYKFQTSLGYSTAIDFIDVWDNNNTSNNTFGIWLRVAATQPGQYFLTNRNSGFNGEGEFAYVDVPSYFQVHSDSTILKITKYDNVGGVIEGTFSGSARIANNLDDQYDLQPLGMITNGEFRVKRVADR